MSGQSPPRRPRWETEPVTLAACLGLPLPVVRRLLERYPAFRLCVTHLIKDVSRTTGEELGPVLARRLRAVLNDAIDRFEQSVSGPVPAVPTDEPDARPPGSEAFPA